MNTNNKITSSKLNEAIDNLSKSLYLESPDLWIDFSDKMNDNNFDEMVLFFAIKYNQPNIIMHAVESNLIDLDSPSKNKSFSSIKDHLLSIANQNKNTEIYNYLINGDENTQYEELSINDSDLKSNSDSSNEYSYIPTFICPKCNSNIFNTGYIVLDKVTYKFSAKSNKIIPSDNKTLDYVSCNNCGDSLKEVSPDFLKNLSSVQNCTSCGLNLTNTGIIDKIKMHYDKDLSKFINSNTSYHCSHCDKELNNYQKEHFNL